MTHAPVKALASSVLTLSALGEAAANCDDVVAMFVAASADADLCAATYLPAKMDFAQAKAFCAHSDGFVIRENGEPAGVLLTHPTPRPGEGVQLPAGCVEIERWVLQRFRGRGLLQRTWPALQAVLALRFAHLAAVCWEDNSAARQSLRACGFQELGRSFWTGEGESGWCAVYVYDLRNPLTMQPQTDLYRLPTAK